MNSFQRLAAASAILASAAAHAEVVTYEFTGTTGLGGYVSPFTGTINLEVSIPSSTVYYNGTGPMQGFATQYIGAVLSIDVHLDASQHVSAGPGYLQANNITQAEAGTALPQGLSLQAYGGQASGVIHDQGITFLYLAFIPVDNAFNWDALDAYFNGNAEDLLNSNPSLLSPSIDPTLTDTEIPLDLNQKYTNGLFLGTVHSTSQGVFTTLNQINSFSRVVVPSCPADLDDGSQAGTPDGGVDVNDLLFFLVQFEGGSAAADLDNGTNTGTPDGGVDVNDLLFFLAHFESGC